MRISDWSSDVCSSDLQVQNRLLSARADRASAAKLHECFAFGFDTDKLKFPDEMLFRPACLGEALAAALDTLAVKVHDARARGGIEVGFALILGTGVLAQLHRAACCFRRGISHRTPNRNGDGSER